MSKTQELELFRQEAVKACSTGRAMGSVRLNRMPSYTVMTACSTVVLLSIFAYACVGGVTRKERVTGALAPAGGMTTVAASTTGVLVERSRREGDRVSEGETLAVLAVDLSSTGGSAAVQVSRLLQSKQEALGSELALRKRLLDEREADLKSRLQRMAQELEQGQADLKVLEERVRLSTERVARSEGLSAVGFLSKAGAEEVQFQHMDAQSRLASSRRLVTVLERDIQVVQSQLQADRLQADADLSALSRAQLSVQQEITENQLRQRVVIKAPKSGVLSVFSAELGSSVQSGQQLGVIIPNPTDRGSATAVEDPSALQARLYVRSRAIGFMKEGQEVWMRYDAFPYAKFGAARGVVERVTSTPLGSMELPPSQARSIIQSAQTEEPLYRVDVKLDRQYMQAFGRSMQLKPGMQLEADVILEERKIYEWLLEPILAMRQNRVMH